MNYPSGAETLPAAQALFAIITGNAPLHTALALKSVWTVQGYLQGVLVGEPKTLAPAGLESTPLDSESDVGLGGLSDSDAVLHLGELCAVLDADVNDKLRPASVSGMAIDTALRLLLPVLQRWALAWLSSGGLQRLVDQLHRSE